MHPACWLYILIAHFDLLVDLAVVSCPPVSQHYGLEVDRILAWRYKNSAVVHRTADGTIATGGDSVRAPFEGQEQHLHIHPAPSHGAKSTKTAAAAAAAAPTDSAAAAAPATSSTKKSAGAASSAASASSIPAPHASAAVAAPAARETSGRAQSAAAAKKAAREAAIEAKAQAKAAKAAAKEAAAAGKRGRKRKKDDEPAEAPEPPVAASALPAAAPAAAGAVAPEKGKGRRPKFTPLSKEDALAAFQRTLSAARESAGLASQPVTGLYASKKERLANREAAELAAERREEEEAEREAESSDEEEVEADADAASSDDSEGGEGSDEEEEGDEDDEAADSDAEGDDEDGRPSKRRRTVSAKAAASSAAAGGKRSKSKSKKAKEAAKKKSRHAGRPSTTAVRNALIAENSDKEFFVTLKGRSYLHAKWSEHEEQCADRRPCTIVVPLYCNLNFFLFCLFICFCCHQGGCVRLFAAAEFSRSRDGFSADDCAVVDRFADGGRGEGSGRCRRRQADVGHLHAAAHQTAALPSLHPSANPRRRRVVLG
jgi:hypothetical protein